MNGGIDMEKADLYLSSVSMTGFDYSSAGMMVAIPHSFSSTVLQSIKQTEEIRKELEASDFKMDESHRKSFQNTRRLIEASMNDANTFGKTLKVANTDEYLQFCIDTIRFIDKLLA